MRKQKKSFPLYRLFLHLYPKSYRKQYGEQMLQTLQDMVDDQTTFEERALLWLRVMLEMPVSIIQENVTAVTEKATNRLTSTSNKGLKIGVDTIVLVAIAIGVGYTRGPILKVSSHLLYGRHLQAITVSANTAIQNPFELLTATNPKPSTGCDVIAQRLFSTEVDCQTSMQSYAKLGQTTNDKMSILQSVATIEQALKANGYVSGSYMNGATLTSLVSGTYKGIDWSPDASYEKVSGDYDCIFDTQIAYSNLAHQQPAIHLSLSCSRTFDIVGTPSSQTYSSKIGIEATAPSNDKGH